MRKKINIRFIVVPTWYTWYRTAGKRNLVLFVHCVVVSSLMASAYDVDARLLGKPPRFLGDEAEWSDWEFATRAYLDTVDPLMGGQLDVIETTGLGVMDVGQMNADAQANSKKL